MDLYIYIYIYKYYVFKIQEWIGQDPVLLGSDIYICIQDTGVDRTGSSTPGIIYIYIYKYYVFKIQEWIGQDPVLLGSDICIYISKYYVFKIHCTGVNRTGSSTPGIRISLLLTYMYHTSPVSTNHCL